MTPSARLVAAAASLREALEETAAALAAADRDRLLRSELALQLALETLASRPALDPADREILRDEIARAQRALQRSRQLGDAMLGVVHAGLAAQGRAPAYGRHDAPVLAGGLPGVNTRG